MPAAPDHLLHAPITLALKRRIAHRQRLVNDQYLGLECREHRECEADRHARGIDPHRAIEEVAEVGKFLDLAHVFGCVVRREAQKLGGLQHVGPAGKFGVESSAQFQQGKDLSAHLEAAGGRPEGSAEQAKQRALSRSVAADDPQAFSPAKFQSDVAQCPEITMARR